MFDRQINYKWPFSIAILNYQMVFSWSVYAFSMFGRYLTLTSMFFSQRSDSWDFRFQSWIDSDISMVVVLMLFPHYQWEFQDPKMEVLYHIRPYFVGIFPYIRLMVGASNFGSWNGHWTDSWCGIQLQGELLFPIATDDSHLRTYQVDPQVEVGWTHQTMNDSPPCQQRT